MGRRRRRGPTSNHANTQQTCTDTSSEENNVVKVVLLSSKYNYDEWMEECRELLQRARLWRVTLFAMAKNAPSEEKDDEWDHLNTLAWISIRKTLSLSVERQIGDKDDKCAVKLWKLLEDEYSNKWKDNYRIGRAHDEIMSAQLSQFKNTFEHSFYIRIRISLIESKDGPMGDALKAYMLIGGLPRDAIACYLPIVQEASSANRSFTFDEVHRAIRTYKP